VARNVLDGTGWLTEQRDSSLTKAFSATSVVDAEFRPINMTANTVRIPRIADMDVEVIAKGAAYPEDQSSADTVAFSAVKIGAALRIAEEDVDDDQLANYIDEKKASAGSSYAKKVDNAALGTTAASNGLTVPFTSLYRALTTADASTGYTANANLETYTPAVLDAQNGITNALSAVLENIEGGDYFNPDDLVWILHPSFRKRIRDAKDSTGRPLFFADWVNGVRIDRLFDIPVRYSTGAKTTTVATTRPGGAGGSTGGPAGVKGTAGNPLGFLVQKQLAVVGRRKAFESVYIPGRDGTSALTDEDILKVRARIGVGYTIPGAHAGFELVTA
jgi:HK97 family phage major capsid protein